MGLREQRREQTRSALASAALELFLRDGFEATTMDAVAEAAGVSRSTAFRYFDSKEALFFARQRERQQRFAARVAAHRGAGLAPWPAVRAALLDLAAVYTAERATLLAQERLIRASRGLRALDLQVDEAWEQAIAEALADGAPADGPAALDARVQAGAVVGAIRAVIRHWLDRGADADLRTLGARALDLLQAGLAPGGDHP